ncbi:MAG: 2-C-methyl-D-erythritol 4-phosphate cytidylyltransferase [Fibrobacterota bacterium]
MRKTKASIIIPAGGSGRRMGGKTAKQFLKIGDRTILERTLSIFNAHPRIAEIVLVLPPGRIKSMAPRLIAAYPKITGVVAGGATRVDSVTHGFHVLSKRVPVVLVHDCVRPFVTHRNISDVIVAASRYDAVTLGVPVKDTLKVVRGTRIMDTPDRSTLWHTQTPQGFKYDVLKKALALAKKHKRPVTDECQLAERLSKNVHVVMGDYRNIKITTPEDLAWARAIQ